MSRNELIAMCNRTVIALNDMRLEGTITRDKHAQEIRNVQHVMDYNGITWDEVTEWRAK